MSFLNDYSSEVIALCALLLTIWQLSVQRSHNKVSVRPHLFVFRDNGRLNHKSKITVYLINNGLGPAYINDFKVYLDGVEAEAQSAVETVFGKRDNELQYMTLDNDFAIAHGQRVSLISILFPVENWDDVETMESCLDRLQIVVNYSSAYQSKFVLDTRSGPENHRA